METAQATSRKRSNKEASANSPVRAGGNRPKPGRGITVKNRLQQTEQALREREITLAALANVAPVGIMRFDEKGRCNYVNARWSKLTGRTIDQAIGDGWTEAIHPKDRAAVLHRWEQMRTGDTPFREEFRLCRSDGTMIWVFAEGAALRSYSGETIGFIRAITDITRHRQLEAELMEARRELEARVRERTAELEVEMGERQKLEKQVLEIRDDEQRRFSQDLHDGLGQHLTGILFRTLALQRDLEGEQSPHGRSASKIADLVNQTISQAHDLARGVQPVPVRPNGLVCALEELVKVMCDPHVADCRFECDEPVYLDDNTVATHVYRIAQEALTNAIKHSNASIISLKVRSLPGACELCVEDDGNGLCAKVDGKRGRGMSIMRHRARLIDAAIEVHSSPERGTTLTCRFRLPPARQNAP